MLRYSLLSILGVFLVLACNKEDDGPVGEKPSIVLEFEPVSNSPHRAIVNAFARIDEYEGYDSLGFCIATHSAPDIKNRDSHGLFPLSPSVKWGWNTLTPNQTYYVRAVIYGKMGVIYSNEISFTTDAFFTAELNTLNKEVMVFDSIFNHKQAWSDQLVYAEANSSSDGKLNSNKIAAKNTNGAANYCDDLVYAGFDDWYLPAEDEMKDLISNHPDGIILHSLSYWTSTEVDNLGAKALYRKYMVDPLLTKPTDKIEELNMVCIREK